MPFMIPILMGSIDDINKWDISSGKIFDGTGKKMRILTRESAQLISRLLIFQ